MNATPGGPQGASDRRDHAPPRLVLGLDAGGTKIVCLLARAADGAVLGRGVGGAGNILAAGAEKVAQSLAEAIGGAFAAAGGAPGGPPGTVAVAAIGAAGAARADDRAALEALLRRAIAAERYVVTSDGAIALRAALPRGPGVLLISGTGSIGYGRAIDGREVRAGGWGYLLDDAGSAFAVGLAGLRAVLRAHDGRGSATALRASLLAAWGLGAPEAIIGRVYQHPPPREAIAALAPLVLAAARAGDAAAGGIIAEAGGALGEIAAAAIAQLGTAPGDVVPLVTDGGFLRVGADDLLPHLLGGLRERGLTVAHRTAEVEAAHGALLLARETPGGDPDPAPR